jgi:hypothetical protein
MPGNDAAYDRFRLLVDAGDEVIFSFGLDIGILQFLEIAADQISSRMGSLQGDFKYLIQYTSFLLQCQGNRLPASFQIIDELKAVCYIANRNKMLSFANFNECPLSKTQSENSL